MERCAKRHKSNDATDDYGVIDDVVMSSSSDSNSVSELVDMTNNNSADQASCEPVVGTQNSPDEEVGAMCMELMNENLNRPVESCTGVSCTELGEERQRRSLPLIDETVSTQPTNWRKTNRRMRNYRKPARDGADSSFVETCVYPSCAVINYDINEPCTSSNARRICEAENANSSTVQGEDCQNTPDVTVDNANAESSGGALQTVSEENQNSTELNAATQQNNESTDSEIHIDVENNSDSEPNVAIEDDSDGVNFRLGPYMGLDSGSDEEEIRVDDEDDELNIMARAAQGDFDIPEGESPITIALKKRNADTEVILQEVMGKPKPTYTWNSTYELMRREHGFDNNRHCSRHNGMVSNGFVSRFYSSRHVVERMKLTHTLRKHKGCVNCLNFNRVGDLLCTGSDDTQIIVWNWASNEQKLKFRSGHTSNIFQTKFLDNATQLEIVSASRDGQVRRAIVPPSGGRPDSECLYKHRGAVHKIVICPHSPREIISVGEDGRIYHRDLRVNTDKDSLETVIGQRNRKVRLLSISHHPFAPQICVSGSDNLVRVYDKRFMNKTFLEMYPANLSESINTQITCVVYDSTGNDVLASYSDEHIYLFNAKGYKPGEYLHRYRGHFNHKTIKGVNFFGPNSEYVISGSDCGHLFFWDKNTEAILNFLPADSAGVVNCLEPHPNIPVLATSGLDHNIKIWTPNSNTYPPDLSKLERCVKHNLGKSVTQNAFDIGNRSQIRLFVEQFLRESRSLPRVNIYRLSSDEDYSDSDDDMSQAWSTDSSTTSTSSGDDDENQMDDIQCRTQ